jgi:nucleoside-diphosphate-sugar epimerase
LAEELVIQANRPGFETIALRPPLIWGPDNPLNAEIREAVSQGRWVWIGGGAHTLSTLHVRNLAAALIAAIERGRGEQIYYVTDDERRSIKQFFTQLLLPERIELGHRSIPRQLALVVAYTIQFLWQLFRIKNRPPMTPVMVHLLGTEFSVSDKKARSEMGYQNALSVDEGLRRLKPFSRET